MLSSNHVAVSSRTNAAFRKVDLCWRTRYLAIVSMDYDASRAYFCPGEDRTAHFVARSVYL